MLVAFSLRSLCKLCVSARNIMAVNKEKYQEINGVKYDFDDKKVLGEMFELMGK